MPYIMYSEFQRFICSIFDFMMFYDVPIRSGETWFLCQNYLFSSPAFVCLRANLEPKSCRFRPYKVPVSSSTGTAFEPRSCQFRAQKDILSSPNCDDFVLEPCIFQPCSCCYRYLFELLLSPVRALVEPFVLCPFEHWLLNMLRGKTWRFFSAGQFQQA